MKHTEQPQEGGFNPKKAEFGAIGDGKSHPLSDKYTTLAEAQVKFPHATSLTDEIDWCAIQGAIYAAAAKGGAVILPASIYIINKPLLLQEGVILRGLGNYAKAKSAQIRLADNANSTMLMTPAGASGNIEDRKHHICIENICWDGNYENQSAENIAIKFWGVYVGSWIHNCLISNTYGPALSLAIGSDLEIVNTWINGAITDGYAVEINKDAAAGTLQGSIYMNNLYIENTRTAAAGAAGDPRNNPDHRGKGILIRNVVHCHITELHQEGLLIGADIEDCHLVRISAMSLAHVGNESVPDCAFARMVGKVSRLIYLGTGTAHNYTSNWSFLKKAAGVGSNHFPNIPQNVAYLGEYIGTNDSSLPLYFARSKVTNELMVKRVGSESEQFIKINATENDETLYGYMSQSGEYTRFGSTYNQGTTKKTFLEYRSTGNLGERINTYAPMYFVDRNSNSNLSHGAVYNLNGVLTRYQDGVPQAIVMVRTGTTAPTVTPHYIGEEYIDTTNKIAYKAVGLTASDWKRLTE
ncbi:glycosyl hydrolase family 28-related protein [Paenibacillus medicaginis]|uniref:Glycosyl hydrolase family 28-related protein n=1 Tax=Paenibacillus medicaginis TaxID=1470560 RepID=A0ABV5BY89_9BACL